MIRAEGASLVYMDHGREIHACQDVTMAIAPDEFVGVLGPSGSGKSSLLYLLSGLKSPTMGRVYYNDTPYSEMQDSCKSQLRLRKFGFVFQQPFLIGYLSALENVIVTNQAQSEAKALEGLERMGLREKAHRKPAELSVGEKQRVCVARALFNEPDVVFADEPTAALDHAAGESVVSAMSANRKGALIMVTHDPSMLKEADRIFVIESGRASVINKEELHR